ncbi:polyprotein [Nephila clavipes virus 5]|nr:polyprotein [Nephila clavipes virus 5]
MEEIEDLLPAVDEIFSVCPNDENEERTIHNNNKRIYSEICNVIVNIKERHNLEIDKAMKGEEVYKVIDTIQVLRHDLLHLMVADTLHELAIERPMEILLAEKFEIGPEFTILNDKEFKKTPDIVWWNRSSNVLWVMDVAVSISAKVVSGLKERKYKQLMELTKEVLKQVGNGDTIVKFLPIVMDQNLANLEVALLPLNRDLSGKKKQILRLITKELNGLILSFINQKLSNDPKEIETFHALRMKSSGTESPMVHPLPSEDSLNRLKENKYFKHATNEYKEKYSDYLKQICHEFKRTYAKDSDIQLKKNQIFTYPSEAEITGSILQMEKTAEEEYEHFSKPKPSLHYCMALTARTVTVHDGKLDLLQINHLKRLVGKGLRPRDERIESQNMKKLLEDYFSFVPDIESDHEMLPVWSGKVKADSGSQHEIKGTTTINFKALRKHKSFLEEYIGLNKKVTNQISAVKSLPFWNERMRDKAENFIAHEGMLLSEARRNEEMEKPKRSGIEAIDEVLKSQYDEISPIFNMINNCQAAHVSKQISEMSQSMLIQRKKEANHVQILNKGDRGFFIMTFPHRLLETNKTGNTVPFINLFLKRSSEKIINEEIVEFCYDITDDICLCVSRGMRLDVPRIESLCHSYELYLSIMLGWITSGEKPQDDLDLRRHYVANGFLFYLCHSVHLRTGGLLDNLRYMFMDVTAEKSNFRMFMMDNGKMALKNSIQVALYSRIRRTLPQYSKSSALVQQREPEYDSVLNEVKWGTLGVDNVKIPSLISPGYFFDSFMSATNEIVGLFFAVPKDLHGEFHKMVALEKIPFVWQVAYNNRKKTFLDWKEVATAIKNGGAEKQTVDLEFVYHVGKWVNEHSLQPRKEEFLKQLSKVRMHDSLLSHKQFTSSHSCIRKINEEGYAERNKVLLTVLERIEDVYKSEVPSFWDFCIDCVETEEPFRFVISPKGQRSKDDREIYIGNLESFSLRLVEKVFAVVCSFQENEAIHVAGDKKFINMQTCFKRMLHWSRGQFKNMKDKKDAKERIKKLQEIRRLRDNKEGVETDWTKLVEKQELISKYEDEIFKSISGESLINKKYKDMKEQEKVNQEIAEETRLKSLLLLPDSEPNIVFLNGDRTKWSAADICEKFCVFIDALTVIPKHIRTLLKCILMKHDDKQMHLSQKLHLKYLTFDDERFNEFKEICGNKPCGKIAGNWFQGMLNFTSSSFHAGTQELSWHLIKTEILNQLPTEFVGLCHSDDEIGFIGFGSYDKNLDAYKNANVLHQNPLMTILTFHNILGSLGCMNYSLKKTNIHLKVSEFVSLFLIWGDQQFPYMKHLATAISGLPGTGLDDDVYSALSQVMMAAMRGCPMSILLPILTLAQQRIDRMYSTGKQMYNDAGNILNIPRQYLPLELGGLFLPGPLPLLLAGPAIHDVCIIKAALENKLPDSKLCGRVLKCFFALTPAGLIKSVADDDPLAQQEKYTSSKLSGFQGMIFKNYLPKKKDLLLSRFSSEMTKERELEFMLKRPTASVTKPSTGDEALDYWKMVISKPAWIRSVRKEGARGMAIKRAQWVKGEHVKLRYDEDWKSLKDCLKEVSDFVNDERTILNNEQMDLLKEYVYNVSSTTCSIIDYLSKIYVKKQEKVDKSIRIAEFLNRPATYRDIKNDVKKVISYIWDKDSYVKEFQHVKFEDMLADDIGKIKSFYKPTLERKNVSKLQLRLSNFYRELQKKVRSGSEWKDAMCDTKVKVALKPSEEPELIRLIHEVYSEPSWVYKQFEEQQRTRVVVTSANNPSFKVTERLIMYNTLRWGTFHMTSGVPLIRQHPTMLPSNSAKECFKFNEYIDTIGILYKRLVQMRLSNSFIKKTFYNLGMENGEGKFVSLRDILRKCIRYAVESPELSMQCKKILAVVEVAVLGQTTISQIILANYKHPLGAWTREQKHVGGGKYIGEFEYKSWVGDHILVISGSNTEDIATQKWEMLTNDSSIATDLLSHACREIFKSYDMGFTKLKPVYARTSLASERICKSQSRWVIKTPAPGDLYIPIVKIDRKKILITGSIHDSIKMNPNGLGLWQPSKYDRRMMKLISIKHTTTRLNRAVDIIVTPTYRGRLVVDGVDLTRLIDAKLLPPFLNNTMDMVSLEDLSKIVVVNKRYIDQEKISSLFSNMRKFTRVVPDPPDFLLNEAQFPPVSGDDFLRALVEGDDDEEDLVEDELFSTNDYFDEIPIENIDQSILENLTISERDQYLEAVHNRKIAERPSIDSELFYETDRKKFELYHSAMDEEMEIKDCGSSGSSKVSFQEVLETTPGVGLEEKLIYQALCLEKKGPTWYELIHFIVEYQRRYGKKWIVKDHKNRDFILRCWSLIAECFLNSLYGDTNFQQSIDLAREFMRNFDRKNKGNDDAFENYHSYIIKDLILLTYNLESEDDTYLM